MWSELGVALALVLVIEGLLPAISPRLYRRAVFSVAQLDERSMRLTGLLTMILGAVILYLIKH